jgi:hypothetical protein
VVREYKYTPEIQLVRPQSSHLSPSPSLTGQIRALKTVIGGPRVSFSPDGPPGLMTHRLFQYVVHRPLPQLWFRSDLRTDLRCPGPLRYRHGIYPGSGFRERPRDLLKFMVSPATCAEGVRYRLPRRYRHLLLPFSPDRLVCTVLDCWGQYPRSRCCRVISGGAVAGFIGRYIGRHPMLYPSCRGFHPT